MTFQVILHEEIHATPDRVFDVFCDLDRLARWVPEIVRVERLTDDSFGPGTRWRETRRAHGREAREEFEVTAVEVHRAVEVFVDGARAGRFGGHWRLRYEFEAHGDRTRVTLRGEVGGLGAVEELLARVFSGGVRKSLADDLRAMKRHVEGPRRDRAVSSAA